MAIRSYDLELDTSAMIETELMYGRKGDTTGSVILNVSLNNNGVPVDLTGYTLKFRAQTPAGLIIEDSSNFNEVDLINGKFKYAVTSALWQETGTISTSYFIISDKNGNKSTLNLRFQCLNSADFEDADTTDYIDQVEKTKAIYNSWFNQSKEIIGSIDPGGKVLTELIDARGSFNTLGARENNQDTQISTKSDKSYVDTMLSSIAQGGPKGIYYSLSALQAAYPSGSDGTYLVFDSSSTDGAHSYIWDSSTNAWKDLGVYQAMALAKKSVSVSAINQVAFDQVKNDNSEISSAICTDNVSAVASQNDLAITFKEVNSSSSLRGVFIPVERILDRDLHLVFDFDASKIQQTFNQQIYLSENGTSLKDIIGLINVSAGVVERFDMLISSNTITGLNTESFYIFFVANTIGSITLKNFAVNTTGSAPEALTDVLTDTKKLIDNKRLNYSNVVENLADITNFQQTSGVIFSESIIDFKIANTSGKLQAFFVPISAVNRNDLVLNLNLTELDIPAIQGSLQIYLCDLSNNPKKVIGILSPMSETMSLKVSIKNDDYSQIGADFKIAIIVNNYIGKIEVNNFLVNDDGQEHTLYSDLKKIDENLKSSQISYDRVVNNFLNSENYLTTSGMAVSILNTDTVEIDTTIQHSSASSQYANFFCEVKNTNLTHKGKIRIVPKNISENWIQQVYLTDSAGNIVSPLATVDCSKDSEVSAYFDIETSNSIFGIAIIGNTLGSFYVELIVNDVDGENTNLTELAKKIGANYDSNDTSISKTDFSTLSSKSIAGIKFACSNDSVGIDESFLKKIYAYVKTAGTYIFEVGSLDQNNLIVGATTFSLDLSAGMNTVDVSDKKISLEAASRVFMDLSNAELFDGDTDILIQTSDKSISDGIYGGMYMYKSVGTLPFGFLAESKTISESVSENISAIAANTVSINTLKSKLTVVSPSGVKFKITVDDNGNLTAKNSTPNIVRIFGNSLTANNEGFGLAASDNKHDYYYLISQYITGKNSKADISRHSVGTWEGSTTTADRQTQFDTAFKPYLSNDTDLVIIQCMENVGSVEAKSTLEGDSKELLRNIKKISPNAEIIWVYGWWGDDTIFKPAKDACDAYGATPINLIDIGNQKSMQSYSGQTRTLDDNTVRVIQANEATHPGDAGMQAIADRIISSFDF